MVYWFLSVLSERRSLFKNPKTDSGTKQSAKGLLRVEKKIVNICFTKIKLSSKRNRANASQFLKMVS
jgi:hypothetical protein